MDVWLVHLLLLFKTGKGGYVHVYYIKEVRVELAMYMWGRPQNVPWTMGPRPVILASGP